MLVCVCVRERVWRQTIDTTIHPATHTARTYTRLHRSRVHVPNGTQIDERRKNCKSNSNSGWKKEFGKKSAYTHSYTWNVSWKKVRHLLIMYEVKKVGFFLALTLFSIHPHQHQHHTPHARAHAIYSQCVLCTHIKIMHKCISSASAAEASAASTLAARYTMCEALVVYTWLWLWLWSDWVANAVVPYIW